MAKQKVVDLIAFEHVLLAMIANNPSSEELEKLVKRITATEHPSDCKYEEDPDFPGTCKNCHWIAADAITDCQWIYRCDRKLRNHVLSILKPNTDKIEVIHLHILIVTTSGKKRKK